MTVIRAVFFDFYNTIARFDPPREELQYQACQQYDIEVVPEGISEGYSVADNYMAQEVARAPLSHRTQGELRDFFAEYERLVLLGSGIEVSTEVALKIFGQLSQIPVGYALFDDVLPMIRILRTMDIRLGLISNLEADMSKLCLDLGISCYFTSVINSNELGVSKPHPSIFIEAMQQCGVNSSETIHVGDQYETDVRGATGAGIRAVLIDRESRNPDSDEYVRIRTLGELAKIVFR